MADIPDTRMGPIELPDTRAGKLIAAAVTLFVFVMLGAVFYPVISPYFA
jgi:hypothetical protein